MFRKRAIIIFILGLLVTFPAFSQPKKKIYITLDTSGSMYGDKYMISNYTAQLISVLGRNDDVYLICNGIAKKISGNEHSYKQIQFDYSLIRSRWGMSSLGSQIGDIAAFNNEYNFNFNTEQWLFILGDGNWESQKFTPVINRFADIIKQGSVNVFFIPYGNVNDGHSDFIDFIRSLKSPKILHESRQFGNVMSNCIIIYSYLTGSSAKNIQLNYYDNKTIKVTSPLSVKKYILYYQDEADEKQIAKPISAVQDSVSFNLNFVATPSTASLRYKDNQTLVSGTIWEIEANFPAESDIPLVVSFNKPVDIKRLKLFPVYDLEINNPSHLIGNRRPNQGNIPYRVQVQSNVSTNTSNNSVALDSVIHRSNVTKKLTAANIKNTISLTETTTQPIQLQKITTKDSTHLYRASVKVSEKIDTTHYELKINHNKQLLFKNTTVKVDSDRIILTLEPRNRWSEAFIPDTLSLKATLTPKQNATVTTTLIAPKTIVLKAATTENGLHTSRNRNKLLLVLFAAGWLMYFFVLARKARFKRGAVVEFSHAENTDDIILRASGVLAWFNRWLNPLCAERRVIAFQQSVKPITFTANRTPYSIRLLASEFDKASMTYQEYSPSRGKYVEFIENRALTVQELPEKGSVAITYNSIPKIKDDRPIFSTFIWVVSILIICFLILI